MTRCLWIFGAYTYRMSRRHSTVILVATFIITITIILQLYSYRHSDYYNGQRSIGDFDYRPGNFLKGRMPNENTTYCDFQYGLPDKLDWDSFQVSPSPELGPKGNYKVIYNAIKATAYVNNTRYNAVTYATQATPEFIYHIVEIARFWDGPISLAVYVPNYDLDITIQIMTQLCNCYEGMTKVSLHLYYPKRHPPLLRTREQKAVTETSENVMSTSTIIPFEMLVKQRIENIKKMDNKTRAEYIKQIRQNKARRLMMSLLNRQPIIPNLKFLDCSGLHNSNLITFRKLRAMVYPINVGRNVARNASKTNFFLVSDIEMIPSDGLASKFLVMVRKLMGDEKRDKGCVFTKTVFVVPLFEVEKGEDIPRDKETLVRLVEGNRAMYFHQRSCSHCQRFPGLQKWLARPSPETLEPMVITKRVYPYHRWEPLYFGTDKEPWYSEVLSWDGRQDKMTQMLELCFEDYRLVVVDGGFLCHAASYNIPNRNWRAMSVNAKRYNIIVHKLLQKYKDKPVCKVK